MVSEIIKAFSGCAGSSMSAMVFLMLFYSILAGNVRIKSTVVHDRSCFTQGLFYHGDYLYESCGLTEKSHIRIFDTINKQPVKSYKFSKDIFAEGLVVVKDLLFVLTWKNRKAFVFDAVQLSPLGYYSFDSETNEGWGIAVSLETNSLILSDGSAVLTFYDIPTVPRTAGSEDSKYGIDKYLGNWKVQRTVKVTRGRKSIKNLNELEYVNGYVFANVWFKEYIIKIDPSSGRVVDSFDCAALVPKNDRQKDVLNGIAYNETAKLFYVTGKLWPVAYHVELLSSQETVGVTGELRE